ncbi:SDR family oxidoreductase [Nocardia rhamnosiphila]|uniref:SDR family oxidoreductase n=1 Tax=Nocardia rhamnosiphila TaxID=426716 RepID=UPI0033DC3D8D
MSDHRKRTYVVTGADSGIGADTARTLEERGGRVIRCGVGEDVDVQADIGTVDGRRALVAGVTRLAAAGVDGLALVAGIGAPTPATVSVNYFGTLAVLHGLRPLLLESVAPRVVLISSASALSSGDSRLVAAALGGNESAAVAAARRAVARKRGAVIYRSTKIALNRWVRQHAAGEEWAGSGIPVNVIAPGIVDTDTARRTMLNDSARVKVLAEALPQPLGFPGPVQPIVDAIAWAVGAENSFMAGQIIFIDGGADATLRGDEPYSDGVSYGVVATTKMVAWSILGRLRARGM